MLIAKTKKEVHDFVRANNGKSIGLVPTMGYLHQGHVSLIRAATQQCDVVIVSDFVNPTQFGPNEDFSVYPRDAQNDTEICEKNGVDLLFVPDANEIYPFGKQSESVIINDGLDRILCGASRPGHFNGVVTVVSRLFAICRPTHAFFGEKDYQQLVIVRRMVEDFGFDTQIVPCPIVREEDGLALSSRNVRIPPEQRNAALSLNRALHLCRKLFKAGERDARSLRAAAIEEMALSGADIDYIACVNPQNLELYETDVPEHVIMPLAAKVGNVRLIDNMRLDSPKET